MTDIAGNYREIPARRTDGTPAKLLMRDLGDSRPAYDAQGNVYEAYQTEWQIDGETHFVVVDKQLFASLGPADLRQQRLVEDLAFLDAVGVDITSLDLDS